MTSSLSLPQPGGLAADPSHNPAALGPALVALLSPFRSDLAAGYDAEGQPLTRPMRYLRAPEYFANFKDRAGEWMVYLGACVMGKVRPVVLRARQAKCSRQNR